MEKLDVWTVEVRTPMAMCPVYHIVAAQSRDEAMKIVQAQYPQPDRLDYGAKRVRGVTSSGEPRLLTELSLFDDDEDEDEE